MEKKKIMAFVAVAVIVVAAIGIGAYALSKDNDKDSVEVKLLVAASMTDTMNELMDTYVSETGENVSFTASYGSSGTLVTQLDSMPNDGDILLTASLSTMKTADTNGDITEYVYYLINDLVIICLSENADEFEAAFAEEGFAAFADSEIFSSDDTVAFGGAGVPAGTYTRTGLSNTYVDGTALFSGDVKTTEGYSSLIVPQINNCSDVRAVLSAVETGSAVVGVVYATDASISEEEVTVLYTATTAEIGQVIYCLGLVNNTNSSVELEAAEKFYVWLQDSDTAKEILLEYGWTIYSI